MGAMKRAMLDALFAEGDKAEEARQKLDDLEALKEQAEEDDMIEQAEEDDMIERAEQAEEDDMIERDIQSRLEGE
jgi:hypothetical protein